MICRGLARGQQLECQFANHSTSALDVDTIFSLWKRFESSVRKPACDDERLRTDDPARGAPRPVRTKPEFLGKWWSFADVVPNVKPYSSLAAVLVEVEEQVVDKHVVNGEVVLKRVSKVKNLRLGTGSFLSPGQVLTAAHILTEVVPDERNPDRIFISCATRCVCVPVPQYFRHSAELRLDIKRLMRSKNGGVKAKRVQCLSPTLQSQLKAWVQGRPCPPGPDQAILHLTKPALGVEPISVAPETNWNEVDSMIMRYQTAYCFGLTNVPFVDEDLQMVCSVMSKLPIASVAPSNVDFLSGPPNPFTRLEVAGCSFYGMSGAPILSPGPGSDTSNFGGF